MNIAVLANGTDISPSKSLGLADELRDAGITVLDTRLIDNHKREVILCHRYGIWRYLGGIAYAMRKVHFTVFESAQSTFVTFIGSLMLVAISWRLAHEGILPQDVANVVVLAWLGVFVSLIVYSVVFFVTNLIGLLTQRFLDFTEASAIWIKEPLTYVSQYSLSGAGVPERLHDRLRRAAEIPGTKIKVERFLTDPFVLVTRRRGIFTETCYIGAWNTNVPALDNA